MLDFGPVAMTRTECGVTRKSSMLDFWPGVTFRPEYAVTRKSSMLVVLFSSSRRGATLQREPSFQWKLSFRLDESSISVFFNIFRNLVMQPRFSIIYMVFIGIPAPLPITFAEVVLSSWNDFSFEKIAFRLDESSIFIINHLRPASEGQNHFQCSGTKQLWWKFASRCSETPLFANVRIRLRAFCFTWYHLAPRLNSAFRLDESSISVFS